MNTTARYVASGQKKFFDLWYVGSALVIALALLLASAWLAVVSLSAMVNAIDGKSTSPDQVLATLFTPVSIAQLLSPIAVWYVGVGLIGAFLVFQGVKAIFWLAANWSHFRKGDGQRTTRVVTDVALLLAGGLLEAYAATAPIRTGGGAWIVVYFVLSGGTFVLLRTILQSFFVNFFGDVEIYTTRDQNSGFYALREAILTSVTGTIGQAMSARDAGERRYDRVVILAHSLGSTIAMDALIRLYTLKEQTKHIDHAITRDFASIRAFVTFGASLEKTRYFFDVLRPSVSEAAMQFENDQYGVLFTQDVHVLEEPNAAGGIFWTNLWYEQDPVANEILSYVSYLRPGDSLSSASMIRDEIKRSEGTGAKDDAVPAASTGRALVARLAAKVAPEAKKAKVGQVICYNQRGRKKMGLSPKTICVHGLYLDDPWFWQTANQTNAAANAEDSPSRHVGVVQILTTKASDAARASRFAARRQAERFRVVPVSQVRDPRDYL